VLCGSQENLQKWAQKDSNLRPPGYEPSSQLSSNYLKQKDILNTYEDFNTKISSNLTKKILILLRAVEEFCYANATQAISSPETLNPKQQKKRRSRMDPP